MISTAAAPATASKSDAGFPIMAQSPAGVADNASVADSLRAMQAEGDFQFDFPPPPPPPELPSWLEPLGRALRWMFGEGSTLFTSLFWVIVAIVLLLILYNLVPAIRDVVDGWLGRERAAPVDANDDWQIDTQRARNLLAEADALAAAGQFDAAVRLLLGRSLEDIAVRRPGLLQPALTSRALATNANLPMGARRAFGDLAATVERSLFARQPIDSAAWALARASYAEFALPDRWQGVGQVALPV